MTRRALPNAVRRAGLALALPICAAAAQPAFAQALVQAAPALVPGQSLTAALGRLARDPRDLAALIDAGNAALQMGDVDAAIGFFARADQISPNNMRVKAGLAGALVRSENPYDAIPLFAEAERAGAVDPALAVDRGLAYDLVGDNVSAQRYYRQALAAGSSDEAVRRLALSQAIAGDRKGMEATLSPLLQRQDKGAWRARAFALAILGAPEEGVAIANQVMPADLANGIAPYLRYMPRLTAAQQAAAANLGRFPRAADIGRDDPRVALYAPPKRVAAAVGAGLVPAGEPLGRSRSRSAQRVAVATPAAPVRAAPPEIAPARSDVPPPPVLSPAVAPAAVRTVAVTSPPPSPVASAPTTPVASTAAPRPTLAAAAPASPAPTAAAGSSFDLARVSTAAPRPAPPPPTAPKQRPRLADAFSDLAALPKAPAAPAPGAVDVRRLAEARAKAEAAKVPPKPAHPSRIWVQVGTGRDPGALGFTWRGLAKDNAALFKGQSPSVSDWGRTNRLLAGPFATEAAADAFLAKARKADVDAFVWTSPAGQVVDALPTR